MFNLEAAALTAGKQEEGIEIDLVDPNTDQPSGGKVRVAGLDSRRARDARREAIQYVLTHRKDQSEGVIELSMAERRQVGNRILAGCVISWEGVTYDGEQPIE